MTEQNAAEKVVREKLAAEKLAAEKLEAEKLATLAKLVVASLKGRVFPLSSAPDEEIPSKVSVVTLGGVSVDALGVASTEEKAAAAFELAGNLGKLAGDFLLSVKLWGVFDTRRAFLAEKTLNPTLWSVIRRGDISVQYVKTSGGKSATRSISWQIDIKDVITFAEALEDTSKEKVEEIKDRVAIF